ncbi:MAG: hypothetical protein ACXVHT_08415 [Methanobacterium sp.]
MTSNKKNLEKVSVQQVGKQELETTLKENAHKIVKKAAHYSKKKNKKDITKEEVEEALKIQ